MSNPIDNHFTANGRVKKRDIIIGNFLGGISWGVGSAIGATIVVAIIVSLLRSVNFVPVVGGFVSGVLQTVDQTNSSAKNLDK